jgi:hypothetical protein
VALLRAENLYGAAALLRQIVEVEYLTWAFDEDAEEAKVWLRSSSEERRDLWQPRHLRKRSQGLFRGRDYSFHCEYGGHPTPEATTLLPDHSNRGPSVLYWIDLAGHATSAWDYAQSASGKLGYGDALDELAADRGLPDAMSRWRETDSLREAVTAFVLGADDRITGEGDD